MYWECRLNSFSPFKWCNKLCKHKHMFTNCFYYHLSVCQMVFLYSNISIQFREYLPRSNTANFFSSTFFSTNVATFPRQFSVIAMSFPKPEVCAVTHYIRNKLFYTIDKISPWSKLSWHLWPNKLWTYQCQAIIISIYPRYHKMSLLRIESLRLFAHDKLGH